MTWSILCDSDPTFIKRNKFQFNPFLPHQRTCKDSECKTKKSVCILLRHPPFSLNQQYMLSIYQVSKAKKKKITSIAVADSFTLATVALVCKATQLVYTFRCCDAPTLSGNADLSFLNHFKLDQTICCSVETRLYFQTITTKILFIVLFILLKDKQTEKLISLNFNIKL